MCGRLRCIPSCTTEKTCKIAIQLEGNKTKCLILILITQAFKNSILIILEKRGKETAIEKRKMIGGRKGKWGFKRLIDLNGILSDDIVTRLNL